MRAFALCSRCGRCFGEYGSGVLGGEAVAEANAESGQGWACALAVKGSADGCPVGDTVFVISHAFPTRNTFAGVPAVLKKVRAGGSFHTSTTIPSKKRASVYTVAGRCGGGNLGVLVHLHIAHK